MNEVLRRLVLGFVAALVILAATLPAQAQQPRSSGPRVIVVPPAAPTYNPNYYLPNGLTVSQYYDLSVLASAYAQLQSNLLWGYNPYLSPVANPYLPYNPPAFRQPWLLSQGYPGMGPFGSANFYTNPYFSFLPSYP
jgi:hypothetical protein